MGRPSWFLRVRNLQQPNTRGGSNLPRAEKQTEPTRLTSRVGSGEVLPEPMRQGTRLDGHPRVFVRGKLSVGRHLGLLRRFRFHFQLPFECSIH